MIISQTQLANYEQQHHMKLIKLYNYILLKNTAEKLGVWY